MVAPVVTLIVPLLSAIAPKFLRNLLDREDGEAFAKEVKTFVDRNVTPINNPQDVSVAIEKLQKDPVLSEHMLEMLSDSERDLTAMHLEDLKNARQFRNETTDSAQAQTLLWISFAVLMVIVVVVVGILYVPMDTSDPESKDFLIQIAGTTIGFLTGIGGMFARNIGSAFDFWFGSSAGSKAKTTQIGDLLDRTAAVAAPAATTTTTTTANEGVKTTQSTQTPDMHLTTFRQGMAAAAV